MFRDACECKRVDLCVRDDNPASGIPGPDTGPRKSKVYLWPSEFLALVSCEEAPLKWRRMFAIAAYLYARAGEVIALRWEDIDLERRVAHIHASVNRDTGERKSTKSNLPRRFPIEAELLPLLQAMHKESRGRRPLSPVRADDRKLSRQLKRCLGLAGVDRPELFAMNDPTRKAITFHDLRATGVTWAAVRGDDPLKIKQRAGHRSFSTTEGYIREAENLGDSFGQVFPPLPPSLLSGARRRRQRVSADVLAFGYAPIAVAAKNKAFLVEAPGIEPRDTCARSVVKRRENDADRATKDDATRREVSAFEPMSADEAIRVAAKLAIDTGDLARARALLDLLDIERRMAPVAILATRKSPR
jgi:hypothetical protein